MNWERLPLSMTAMAARFSSSPMELCPGKIRLRTGSPPWMASLLMVIESGSPLEMGKDFVEESLAFNFQVEVRPRGCGVADEARQMFHGAQQQGLIVHQPRLLLPKGDEAREIRMWSRAVKPKLFRSPGEF